MFKSRKKALIFCLILLVVLTLLCLCSKTRMIYNELYPQSSSVEIIKKDSKILVNGTFSTEKLVGQTIDKFKMFNDKVERGDIKINKDIKKDKWYDTMQNIAYYFSNSLENAKLLFSNNKLTIEGSSLSKKARADILENIEKIKKQGLEVPSSKVILIEAVTHKQKIKKDFYELLSSETVEFETGQALIKSESFPLLDKITSKLSVFPEINIVIEGHTDDVGADELNQKLSEDRAVSIQKYLIQKGIDTNRLSTIGYGEYRPAFPNTSDANRQKNRRVEFKIKGE